MRRNKNQQPYIYEDYEEDYELRKEMARRIFLKKRRKKRRRRRIVFCSFLILSILIGYVAARAQLELSNTLNIIARDNENDLSDVDVSNISLLKDDEVVNILLIGADKRATQTSSGRSDSLMIATIDMKNKQLKLTSLMRDMYVNIPGHISNRLNAAYSLGGVSLLYQTLATNFFIQLDGYVLVDFEAFTNVIDQIGGVDITITESEYEHLIDYYDNNKTVRTLQPGKNTMTGKQALYYSRIRKEGNGDFRRTERQRTVMQAIFTKVKSLSLTETYDMMKSVMPYITTDLNDSEIISYMKSVLMMGTTTIHQFRLPVDGTFTEEKIREMAVLVPDIDANGKALKEFIFNKVEE